MTLVEILTTMQPTLRARVSSLMVEYVDGWQVRCSYCLYAESVPGAGLELAQHTVTVDTSALPRGVAVTAWERWPDSTHPMTVDPADYLGAIETMLRDLNASGLVGRLDAVRTMPARPEDLHRQPWPTWLVKTHAGSQAERTAWVRAINTQMQKQGRINAGLPLQGGKAI